MGNENPRPATGAKLLPGWFVERMMEDVWFFGLLTSTGTTICIQSVDSVYQAADGTVWIDVTLAESKSIWTEQLEKPFVAPTERLKASINTQHIVAAFELADT